MASDLLAGNPNNPLGAPNAVLNYANSPAPPPPGPPTAAQSYGPMVPFGVEGKNGSLRGDSTGIPQLVPQAPPVAPAAPAAPSGQVIGPNGLPLGGSGAGGPQGGTPAIDVTLPQAGAGNSKVVGPGQYQSMQGAYQGLQDASQAKGAATLEEGAAESAGASQEAQANADQANRAGAYEQHANERAGRAEADEAEALADYKKQRDKLEGAHEDKDRFWNKQTTGQKVGWTIANVLGGLPLVGGLLSRGIDTATGGSLQSHIANDVASQKDDYEKGVANENNAYAFFKDRGMTDERALTNAYDASKDRAKSQVDSIVANTKSQTVKARAEALKADIDHQGGVDNISGLLQERKDNPFHGASGGGSLYADPKVQAHVKDAQALLEKTGQPFSANDVLQHAARLAGYGQVIDRLSASGQAPNVTVPLKGNKPPAGMTRPFVKDVNVESKFLDASRALHSPGGDTAGNRAVYNAAAKAAGHPEITNFSPFRASTEKANDRQANENLNRANKKIAEAGGGGGGYEPPEVPEGE